jgi:hypothetical protein
MSLGGISPAKNHRRSYKAKGSKRHKAKLLELIQTEKHNDYENNND